jgi:hypothetical protein
MQMHQRSTQVSIQEFDPSLRLECEQKAGGNESIVRIVEKEKEWEEKEKEKEREKDENLKVNGQGVRWSVRNNGWQPELGIMDPVKPCQTGERCGDQGKAVKIHLYK